MSPPTHAIAAGRACKRCLRRSWLLAELSGPLEYYARDRARLLELLALEDGELLAAAAGRRKSELHAGYRRFASHHSSQREHEQTICRHDPDYPSALSGRAAPHMLHLSGAAGGLATLAARPLVTIAGSRRASDYGWEMARSLARGLAASGVTVVAALSDGIAIAAHSGALEAGGASLAVMTGGLDVSCPARRRTLYERVKRQGCAVSELPRDVHGRRWGQLASERILVELAALTVLVEAEDTAGQLAPARIARTLGRPVAAIPGRVTSPLSRGTHALLIEGASLVRCPQDVLDLLHQIRAFGPNAPATPMLGGEAQRAVGLPPRLKATLERVGAGCDTPDRLTRAGEEASQVLLALSELELMGLLVRGEGGRYVPRDALGGFASPRTLTAPSARRPASETPRTQA
jgi:DNA processing protein